jgi:large subunit ribosomal protein L3
MSIGLVGRKVGMTRIFTENGASVPVTVLEMSNNRVTQVRTPENDGYSAVQVAYGAVAITVSANRKPALRRAGVTRAS